MKLYLVQHGKAKTEKEDVNRPLNQEGISQTKNVAQKFIQKNYDGLDVILHSNKLRAKQTAEIIAEIIKPVNGVKEVSNLNPNDDPFIWFNKINDLIKDTMIVGHLPHLKKLCSLLVFNNPDIETIIFVNSGIVCLDKAKDRWQVIDMILPD
jgi:phosphohistidine phosphatase